MLHDTIEDQAVIETERLTLRPLRASDAGLVTLYAGDARVAQNTRSIPHPLPPGTSEAFINRAHASDRSEDIWALDAVKVGLSELLGVIALERIDKRRSEIGYWVAPAFWNTGFATEAVAGLLNANPQQVETVYAEVFQSNPVSARVLTNVGFSYIGDAEAFSVAQARIVPTWTYLKRIA